MKIAGKNYSLSEFEALKHQGQIDLELTTPSQLAYTRRTFMKQAGKALAACGLSVAFTGLYGCSFSTGSQDSETKSQKPLGDSVVHSGQDAEFYKVTTFAFDTVVLLSAYGSKECLDECSRMCQVFHKQFSAHMSGTDIDRINHAEGEFTEVHPDTAQLIKDSLEFSKLSEGKFDITVGAVSLLWDFEGKKKPSDDEIQEGLKHIDYTKVDVEGNRVRLRDPKAKLDVGATAKGWIADRLVETYRRFGVSSGLINLGGNVYAVGSKPDGSPWNIAIRDPNHEGEGYITVVQASDVSIVTSGLYERYFDLDGVRYTHILDAHTGYPAQTDILAVTVAGRSSFMCDGLSTTLFIDGFDKAKALVESQDDIEALFIDTEGLPSFSSHFEEKYPQNKEALLANKLEPLESKR